MTPAALAALVAELDALYVLKGAYRTDYKAHKDVNIWAVQARIDEIEAVVAELMEEEEEE